jgi:hypothetical protein
MQGNDVLNNGDSSTVNQTGWSTAPTGNMYLYHVVGSAFVGNKFKNGDLGNVMIAFCQGVTFAGNWVRADNQYGMIIRASHGITVSGGQFDCSVSTTNDPTYLTVQAYVGNDCNAIVIKGVHFRFQGNQDVVACILLEGDTSSRRISGCIEDCYFGDRDISGAMTVTDCINVTQVTLSGFAIQRNTFYAETNATITNCFQSDANTNFASFQYENNIYQTSGGTISNNIVTNTTFFPERFWGSGSPEGVVTARVGSLYQRIDGGASTSLYVKTSGTSNTGWTAK